VAARHYHHLYDGCVLLAASPRPLRLLVALDWVGTPRGRWGMEALCRTAGWPVTLRGERLSAGQGAYQRDELRKYLRAGLEAAVEVLAAGHPLAVFPEGYPNVDPRPTPKTAGEFLPFRSGFAAVAEMASRRLGCAVPVIPAGLRYHGRQVRLAWGEPVRVTAEQLDRRLLVADVESAVRRLSCD
jgi:Acyltransferase